MSTTEAPDRKLIVAIDTWLSETGNIDRSGYSLFCTLRAALAAAAPSPAAEPVEDWRAHAANWIRESAAAQDRTNKEYPDHVRCYPSWAERVRHLIRLAEELEAEIAQAPFGLEASDSPTQESTPVFSRRWRIAHDGFGLQRDDEDGCYVHIDDAVDVLQSAIAAAPGAHPAPTAQPVAFVDPLELAKLPDLPSIQVCATLRPIGRCTQPLYDAPMLNSLAASETAETASVAAMLKDPAVVHVAMLRGEIAKPALRDLLHAYGADALAQYDRGEVRNPCITAAECIKLADWMAANSLAASETAETASVAGLSDDRIDEVWDRVMIRAGQDGSIRKFARAILAAAQERINGG